MAKDFRSVFQRFAGSAPARGSPRRERDEADDPDLSAADPWMETGKKSHDDLCRELNEDLTLLGILIVRVARGERWLKSVRDRLEAVVDVKMAAFWRSRPPPPGDTPVQDASPREVKPAQHHPPES